MTVLINIIILLAILNVVVFVHELGHLLMAKKVGALVKEFSIGFGPKLFCKKIKNINYCLRLIPLGGFVDILGDEPDEKKDNNPQNLRNKSFKERAMVMLAGVTMNYLLAVVIFYVLLILNGFSYVLPSSSAGYDPQFGVVHNEKIVDYNGVYYDKVIEGTPASKGKIPEQGYIIAVNKTKLNFSSELPSVLDLYKGRRVTLTICNEHKTCSDYKVNVASNGTIGIYIRGNFVKKVSFDGGVNKVLAGFEYSINWMSYLKFNLKSLLAESKREGNYKTLGNSVGGPVALYSIVNSANDHDLSWKDKLVFYISLTADISMTLFLMNMIPIPALDGGRVFLLLLEKLFGRLYNKKIESIAIALSFLLLIILMVAITAKDIVMLWQ